MGKFKRPLANVFTLGARNFATLRDFYQKFGWQQVEDGEDYAAFELGGSVLAVFPVDKLAADGRAPVEPAQGGIRFTIALNVESRDEVDELTEAVRQNGGRITKEPVDAEFFVGRSAYFADPEDNFWEIVWAPLDNSIVAAARRAAGLDSKEKEEE